MEILIILFIIHFGIQPALFSKETFSQDERMQWWREARFGMLFTEDCIASWPVNGMADNFRKLANGS